MKGLDAEITKLQDAVVFTESRSRSLIERLVKAEEERKSLKKELVKYEGVKKQPSKCSFWLMSTSGYLTISETH